MTLTTDAPQFSIKFESPVLEWSAPKWQQNHPFEDDFASIETARNRTVQSQARRGAWAVTTAATDDTEVRESDSPSGIANLGTRLDEAAWRESMQSISILQWPGNPSCQEDFYPNMNTIFDALHWLSCRRVSAPTEPPTYITFEPAGGLIIERRSFNADGKELHVCWTFYNDGRSEETVFFDGRLMGVKKLTASNDRSLI